MGIFDFLKGKSQPPGAPPPADKKVLGHAKVVADKKAQTYDRMEALQALAAMETADAAAALLPRFRYSIDPSITDQEEKEIAFVGIVAAGKEVVPHVIEFCEQSDGRGWPLTYPLKVLREVLDDDAYREELIDLLSGFDTEYSRNVDPKLQVISALEELVHNDVREAVEPFLEDQNETIRFHAVATTFKQNDLASLPALLKVLAQEESVRVKNKIAEGLSFRGWVIPSTSREAVVQALVETESYRVDGEGKIAKTGRESY